MPGATESGKRPCAEVILSQTSPMSRGSKG